MEDGSYISGAFHWHVEIFPNAFPTAGFEWASDFFMSPLTAEQCASALKDA